MSQQEFSDLIDRHVSGYADEIADAYEVNSLSPREKRMVIRTLFWQFACTVLVGSNAVNDCGHNNNK